MPDAPRDPYPDNGFLRDANSMVIGQHDRESDGTEWNTHYPSGLRVGRYDPGTNMTTNVFGIVIGFGNLLTSLLRK